MHFNITAQIQIISSKRYSAPRQTRCQIRLRCRPPCRSVVRSDLAIKRAIVHVDRVHIENRGFDNFFDHDEGTFGDTPWFSRSPHRRFCTSLDENYPHQTIAIEYSSAKRITNRPAEATFVTPSAPSTVVPRRGDWPNRRASPEPWVAESAANIAGWQRRTNSGSRVSRMRPRPTRWPNRPASTPDQSPCRAREFTHNRPCMTTSRSNRTGTPTVLTHRPIPLRSVCSNIQNVRCGGLCPNAATALRNGDLPPWSCRRRVSQTARPQRRSWQIQRQIGWAAQPPPDRSINRAARATTAIPIA